MFQRQQTEFSVHFVTSFGDVKIAEVDEISSGAGRADDVEQCSCGVGYSGLSCEVCFFQNFLC